MSDETETFEITLHRTELVPGGNGARMGFSDDFPDKQFLIIPHRPETSPDGGSPVLVSPNPPTPEISVHSPHSGQEPTPQHDDKAGR